MDGLVVRPAQSEQERQAAFALRLRVFVQEQGVPADEELDDLDETATHVIALLAGKAVGTGRVVCPDSGEARIGRMAVDKDYRRMGIGGHILRALEDEARRQGKTEAILHTQTYVKEFYATHGYLEEGEVFLEVDIEHIQMRKPL